eukprot:TRINITY_DN3237_c0_g1_i10.p1 TRINITY_DN3237_c0_g1~~TRINITY_DN3237_c0_g1_i10.p1  ORF type:complete len:1180 (-),score=270.94 TRINITY_DN3237_c0_g1_i10:16-3555(-)
MDDLWMRALGDEDYINSVKHETLRKKLGSNLQNSIRNLINGAFEGSNDGMIDDQMEKTLGPFGSALENILNHGLKQKVDKGRFISGLPANGKVSFWHYLENLEKVMSSKMIAKVRSLQKVKSSDGKGRALLRMALNENNLEQSMTVLLNRKDITKNWYEPYAFLSSHSDCAFFTSSLVGLNGLRFNLTIDTMLLDTIEPLPIKEEVAAPAKAKKKTIKKKKPSVVSIEDAIDPPQSSGEPSSDIRTPPADFRQSPAEVRQPVAEANLQFPSVPMSSISPIASPRDTPPSNPFTPRSDPVPVDYNSPAMTSPVSSPAVLSPVSSPAIPVVSLSLSPPSFSSSVSPATSPDTTTTHNITIRPPSTVSSSWPSSPITTPLVIEPHQPLLHPDSDKDLIDAKYDEYDDDDKLTKTDNQLDMVKEIYNHKDDIHDYHVKNNDGLEDHSMITSPNITTHYQDFKDNTDPKILHLDQQNQQVDDQNTSESINDIHGNNDIKENGTGNNDTIHYEETTTEDIGKDLDVDKDNDQDRELDWEMAVPSIDSSLLLDIQAGSYDGADTSEDALWSQMEDMKRSALLQLEQEILLLDNIHSSESNDGEISSPTQLNIRQDQNNQFENREIQVTEQKLEEQIKTLEDRTHIISTPEPVSITQISEVKDQSPLSRVTQQEQRKKEIAEMKRQVEEEIARRKEAELRLSSPDLTAMVNESLRLRDSSQSNTTNNDMDDEQARLIAQARDLLLRSDDSPQTPTQTRNHQPPVNPPTQSQSSSVQPTIRSTNQSNQISNQSSNQPTTVQAPQQVKTNVQAVRPSFTVNSQEGRIGGVNVGKMEEDEYEYASLSARLAEPINELTTSKATTSVVKELPTDSNMSQLGQTNRYYRRYFQPKKETNNTQNRRSLILEESINSLSLSNPTQIVAPMKRMSQETVELPLAPRKRSSGVTRLERSRKQVYFNVQTRGTIRDQDSVCFDCGTPLMSGVFASNANYCEYTGKYFCKECISKDKFIIPARILNNWDFKPYPVCNYARELLESIYFEPVFDVKVINPKLYDVVLPLKKLRVLRVQLSHMKGFIMSCRDKDVVMQSLGKKAYMMHDIEFYSLYDFFEIYKGTLVPTVVALTEKVIRHIRGCQLCREKGSICEICKSKKAIYPFNIEEAVQCSKCKGVFHRKCWRKDKCPKCERKNKK